MAPGETPTGAPGQKARTGPARRVGRRALLGGAVTIGAGAGLLKLLVSVPPLAGHDSAAGPWREDWRSPLDTERGRIAHLLRRATFGVSADALDAALRDGFERTVEKLIATPAVDPPNPISPDDPTHGTMLGGDELQKWWVAHMLTTPTPFAERMTLFWHGHFTTDVDKVGNPFTYWQNLTWRRLALGRLARMLREVTVDPAMLVYLDLASSDASDPFQPPNENYARELMELFTIGPGNYTESDVKAAARALAGWTTPPPDGKVEVVVDEATGARDNVDFWSRQQPGVFVPEMAYDGEVHFLGKKGRLQLNDVIGRILAQPATARFLANKAAVHFIAPQPSEATVKRIADSFRSSGYDVRSLIRATFLSPEFAADSSYRCLVKSPVDFMVSAVLALGAAATDSAELIVGYGYPAGQSLFQPPNVAGWPPNGRWISPSTMLARFNFVSQLLDSIPELPPAGDAHSLHLDGVLGAATARRLERAASDSERWLTILTSPEFNLK